MLANKRQFLTLSGASIACLLSSQVLSQEATAPSGGEARGRPSVPHRKATTRVLFKGPDGKYINGISTSPEGLWICEQHETGGPNSTWRYKDGRPLEVPADLREAAWLVDDQGTIRKTVMTNSRNTSGLAVGGGYVWMGANSAGHNGVSQVTMDSKTISLRQVPFGPPDDGGGIHGLTWVNGKLWIGSNRLHGLLRLDATTWNTEFIIPFPTEFARYHGCAYDASNDTMLVVTGNNSTSYTNGQAGLARLDAKTGNLVEVIDFMPNTCDPHGLTFHQGKLVSCDAGLHPGWPLWDSPYSGAIFEIVIA